MSGCPPGSTGIPKPGYADTLTLAASGISAILSKFNVYWAIAGGLAVGSVNYVLNTLCGSAPPPMPTISASDVAAMLQGPLFDPVAFTTARQKFQDLITIYVWAQVCDCTPGPAPAPPAAPAPPSGIPSEGPATPYNNAPCRVFTYLSSTFTAGSGLNLGDAPVADLNVVQAVVSCTNTVATGAGVTMRFNFTWSNEYVSPFVDGNTYLVVLAPGTSKTVGIPVQPGFTHLHLTINNVTGTGSSTSAASVAFYCQPQAPGGGPTPCDPSPALLADLQQILDLVTIIQRQGVPFAFVPGPTHTGLTGNGELVVTEPLIGIDVNVTTVPSSYGRSAGDPDFYFGLGFVALGDADGWFQTRPIEQLSMVWQPRWSGAVTRIGYTLSPGVVANINELQREP